MYRVWYAQLILSSKLIKVNQFCATKAKAITPQRVALKVGAQASKLVNTYYSSQATGINIVEEQPLILYWRHIDNQDVVSYILINLMKCTVSTISINQRYKFVSRMWMFFKELFPVACTSQHQKYTNCAKLWSLCLNRHWLVKKDIKYWKINIDSWCIDTLLHAVV